MKKKGVEKLISACEVEKLISACEVDFKKVKENIYRNCDKTKEDSHADINAILINRIRKKYKL